MKLEVRNREDRSSNELPGLPYKTAKAFQLLIYYLSKRCNFNLN